MDILLVIANVTRHLFSLLAAAFIIVLPAMEKRNKFSLRVGLCIAGCCIFCALYTLFYFYMNSHINNDVIWLITMFLWVTVIAGVVIVTCFKLNPTSFFWVIIVAYATEHFVYVLVFQVVFMWLAGGSVNYWIQLPIYVIVSAGAYFVNYKLLKPNATYLDKRFLQDSVKNRLTFFILFLLFIAATVFNQLNAIGAGEHSNYLSAMSDLINCLFILVVQFVSLRVSRISSEKQISENLMKEAERQYEVFKMNVDYINIKCHDLKHELAAMHTAGIVDKKRIEEAERSIEIYEAFAKTGNKTLDVLLTEKNLLCLSNSIVFSYMADVSMLEIMSAADIYVLFGNLMDNAIEYLKKVEDEDNRFIRLFIKGQENMFLIHEENYCCDKIIFMDGLPLTTKNDSTSHGFGTKSMRQIARKYGGEMKTAVEDELFKVDIYIRKT